MNTIKLTCDICIKTLSSNNALYAHMNSHLTPEYNHLFTEDEIKDIKAINKRLKDANHSAYLKKKNFNVCKICNRGFYNKRYLICHMNMHLTPDTMHLLTEDEIKEIKEVYACRQQIKKRSFEKMKKTNPNKKEKLIPNPIPLNQNVIAHIPVPPVPSLIHVPSIPYLIPIYPVPLLIPIQYI